MDELLVEMNNFKYVKWDFKLFMCYVMMIFVFVNDMENNGCIVLEVLEVLFFMF